MTRYVACYVLLLSMVVTLLLADFASAQTAGTAGTAATAGTAGTAATAGTAGTAGTGGECDFTAIKQSIYGTESGGNYAANCHCSAGALGKYQFIPATRSSYIRNHPECNGSACDSASAWVSPACYQVQECIMDRYLADSVANIKKQPACQQLLNSGQSYTGSGQGKTLTCKATESGIVGAMHLAGNAGGRICTCIMNNNCKSDSYGTSPTYYMCKHGGKPIPGNCTPSPPGTTEGTQQPLGTYLQVTSADAFDPGYFSNTGPADPLREWWDGGLMLMAEQFTANMMAQVQAVGMLLDAKHQMETQRLFQQKVAQAHKDYQPSEQMCTFGTFTRDLVSTERLSNLTREAVSTRILQRETGNGDGIAQSSSSDKFSHIAEFRKRFCDPGDNGNGLKLLCPKAPEAKWKNRDINYTQTLDQPLSLDINLTDDKTSEDEEMVFGLIDNLFLHDPIPRIPTATLDQKKYQYHYMNMRSLSAIRGIARNSIAGIIAQKTSSANPNSSSGPYLKALLVELGIKDDEIQTLMGDNPSYYAQMEILTKKIYQNPNFYTNLYDKPTNVKRIRAAMTAIKLMQDRDIHASLMRREMLLSLILEMRLREKAENVYNAAERSMFENGGLTGSSKATP